MEVIPPGFTDERDVGHEREEKVNNDYKRFHLRRLEFMNIIFSYQNLKYAYSHIALRRFLGSQSFG